MSNNRYYLLTGAAGFLGTNICMQLLDSGCKVRALVLPNDKSVKFIPKEVEVVLGDLTDAASLEPFFTVPAGCTSVVIHCASMVTVNPNYSEKLMEVNVGGTRNIITKVLNHPECEKMVYVSSTGAIPEQPHGTPITEVSKFTPCDPKKVVGAYSQSKATATQMVLDAVQVMGLKACVVHPSGILGPNGHAIGETTGTLLQIIKGEMPMGMQGSFNLCDVRDLAFGNVILISCGASTIDYIRRRRMVDAPVKKIMDALDQVMQGDFTVRIPPVKEFAGETGFNEIITAINAMTAELQGTETLRTDFIANVSHELKTPLAVMGNYATMLQQPEISEGDRVEYAKAISHSSRRLAALITNILKLNKLENQQIFPKHEEYDLSGQLCEAMLQFEDAWENKGLEIETDIQEDVRIHSDPVLLSLVWSNLISNAVKFAPEGGTIGVVLKADDQTVIASVRDTGCGIDPETGKHIFEKFYQGDTSHATQGNGLGLALVKRVMDILQGEITVQSTLDLGSTFTVKIRRNG